MYRHIIFLWLKDCSPGHLARTCEALRGLAGQVTGLLSLEVGEDVRRGDGSCHICINMLFLSKEALDAFRAHPDRLPLDGWLREGLARAHFADYPLTAPARQSPKYYSYIGPSNRDADTLDRLLRAGMHGIRLSLAHHAVKECLPILTALHDAAVSLGLKPEILLEDVPSGDLPKALAQTGATGLILPAPGHAETLVRLRGQIGPDIRLYIRVDNLSHITALPALMAHADVLVIARSALERSLPLHDLPAMQQAIANIAVGAGIPFMVASGVLTSMRQSLFPTAAELSDIYTAVHAGASAFMLTSETAQGQYPVEAMETLRKTVEAARQT